ncbi:MAG: O-antigen ligase family protein [Verrucomicrobiae bacterium]|nr:O-antigen ligase family protein [Verrucomicrobiae bacterium]
MHYTILQDQFSEYVFIGILYFVVTPLLGLFAGFSRNIQRGLFVTMVVLVALKPTLYTTSLHVWDNYRGLPRGFEFSLMEVVAVALIIGSLLSDLKQIKLMPAGLLFYLAYCGLSFVSIVNAEQDVLVWMCLWKFLKGGAVLAAAYFFFKEEKDIELLMGTFALCLIGQLIYVLKQRYVEGVFRVYGGFEHSNPLAMWSYFCSIPLLAAALSGKASWKQSIFYIVGAGAGALIIVLTVTRTAMAIVGVGSMMVIGLSLMRGVSMKRLIIVGCLCLGGLVISAKAFDTVYQRITTTNDTDANNDLRKVLNVMSRAMFDDHPIAGVGWNNSAIVNSRPYPNYSVILERWASIGDRNPANPVYYRTNPQTESLYWLIISENGLLGIVSWVLFCTITFLWCLENAITYRNSWAGFMFLAIAIVLGFAYAHSFLERILTQPKNMAHWLIFLGMAAKFRYLRKPHYTAAFVVLSGMLSAMQGGDRRSWSTRTLRT